MKKALAIIFVLYVISIDAKPKSRARNGDRSSEENEPRNESRKKPPNHMGYKSKFPFPLFKSCLDFNAEYAMRRKELQRNEEIWVGKCKTGEETEQEMCRSQGISSIRCSLPNRPSEECLREIDEFLNGISCDEVGGREIEGNGGDNDETTTEGVDGDFEDEVDEEEHAMGFETKRKISVKRLSISSISGGFPEEKFSINVQISTVEKSRLDGYPT